MPADAPTILATSGGLMMNSEGRRRVDFAPLVHHAVELSGVAGRRPKVVHIGTALGDQRWYAAELDEAARAVGFELNHLHLFPMPNHPDLRELLLGQDVVWVNGGSVANLLAVWRVHGLGDLLREAWQAGVVLAGVSAGSICWYRGGTTDSFGPQLRPVTDGLGLLPYGNGVHYDSEAGRRPLVHELVAAQVLPETHCTDDGVGMHYRGTELVEVLSERRKAAGYVVSRDPGSGAAVERRLEPRLLTL